MKVNATNSCGEYYSSIEIEYDSEKEKDCEQANKLVGVFFGFPLELRLDSKEISEELLERLKHTPAAIIEE